MIMFEYRASFASIEAIGVVLGGAVGCCAVMLDGNWQGTFGLCAGNLDAFRGSGGSLDGSA